MFLVACICDSGLVSLLFVFNLSDYLLFLWRCARKTGLSICVGGAIRGLFSVFWAPRYISFGLERVNGFYVGGVLGNFGSVGAISCPRLGLGLGELETGVALGVCARFSGAMVLRLSASSSLCFFGFVWLACFFGLGF